jgi:autotransporter translocation and assembly factor TamB
VVVTGVIDAHRWSPTRYDLSATVQDARVDLVDELPPMVGDAALSLTGPADDLLLSGEVQIEDMLFADRIDWEQWTVDWRERHLDDLVDQPSARDPLFALDVAVTADGTARVRNNVGDGRLEADLRVVGDDTRIGMVGEVRMQEGGRAFLHEREFDVTRGELRYVDPYSYDPLVDFVLETDVRATDRTYHITYPITGPFSDLSTNPSSDPQLPQVDINALLLFGVTTEDLERTGGAGAALALEGAGLLFAGETSRALDRFGPDALDVFQYTRVDLVTGVSQRGALNSTEWRLLVEQNLAEPVDVTLVGEFSLDDSYLAAERELYDNLYLNVYWSSEQRERSLDIGGAYGADFKVRWESE